MAAVASCAKLLSWRRGVVSNVAKDQTKRQIVDAIFDNDDSDDEAKMTKCANILEGANWHLLC